MPELEEFSFAKIPERDDFDNEKLNINFQSLRIPQSSVWLSLKERAGFLRLKGKESLSSTHTQAIIARRLQHFNAEVTTCVEFDPKTFQQLAGLVVYYNTSHYHYLHITRNGSEKILSIISCDNFQSFEQTDYIDLVGHQRVTLKAIILRDKLQYYYSLDESNFKKFGEVLDMSILSDDYVRDGGDRYRPAFTGCFVGMCCQDLTYNKNHADFDWFEYKEIPD